MFNILKNNNVVTLIVTVASTVIATALCAFFAPITPTISGTAPLIIEIGNGILNFFWAIIQVRMLLLIILFALGMPTVLQIVRGFSKSLQKNIVVGKKSSFNPIPIPPGLGNSYFRELYVEAPPDPLGEPRMVLNRDSLVYDTNRQTRYYLPRNGGKEVDLLLPKPVSHVRNVYVLINSGNSQEIYEGDQIGEIGLIFKEAPPIRVPLILGDNIREWSPGNPGKYVRTAISTTISKVWDDTGKAGYHAIIDCLKIPVFNCMRDCELEKITFFHKIELRPPDTLGVQYIVSGVSLEIEEHSQN